MSKEIVISPKISANKTRNAILRMKNCSPELRSVLRQVRSLKFLINLLFKILNYFNLICGAKFSF